jgi:hypothetical protein
MDFDQRLQKAIDRGQRRGDIKAREAETEKLSVEDVKRLHSQYRLQLSEHIEDCIRRLPNHFPGFQYETIYGERGWGAACKRDDVRLIAKRKRENYYSRLEVTVRPYSSLHVLELAAKGTIRNKEIFNRQHFEKIEDADPARYIELIDAWVLEFAELYSAKN